MKKSIILTFLTVAFIFISCNKDDGNADSPESVDLEVEKTKFVGTWKLQSKLVDGESFEMDDCTKQKNIVFTNNDDIRQELYDFNVALDECTLENTESGIFTVYPDEKVILGFNNGFNQTLNYTFSGNTLKLIGSMDNGESSEIFLKQ